MSAPMPRERWAAGRGSIVTSPGRPIHPNIAPVTSPVAAAGASLAGARRLADFDLNGPATLHWVSKEVPHQRRLNSLRDAVRVAMKELNRAEFFSAKVAAGDQVFSGDQIVEIFQTGGLAQRGYARF